MNVTESSRVKMPASCLLLFFAHGLVFSSWASRIPIVKNMLDIGEAELGTLLLLMPIGQISTMILVGKLTSRYGSSRIIKNCFMLYPFILLLIGFADSYWQLMIILFFFGVSGNLCNIAMNTQAIEVEKLTGKILMASYHGAWCFAGLVGALMGLLVVNIGLSTFNHFTLVFMIVGGLWWYCKRHLSNIPTAAGQPKQSVYKQANPTLIGLGIIGFLSMAIEGAMIDWSGVYLQTIVKAPEHQIMLGYVSFVFMMTLGRFTGNYVLEKYGKRSILRLSGLLMSGGLFLSIIFPELWICIIAFMIIGLGSSLSVPSVYSTVGTLNLTSPGIALSFVSSIAFLGFLAGPPLIGFIAEALDLRYSYGLFACFGILLTFLTGQMKVFRSVQS
ncbi:MFS transporter [Elizabethkingia anophelis]|uniref:MFS transporter n=1 Tax=Elizabethkingia anophelis TaxID=1117645 RepID=UPI000CE96652|nr:MFS transporter [Elizabethkingia anophelis]AVF47843.1 MFS transporter [Elizabethkingia anophelis]AVF51835.1 MFS transporter [Elizabethkingia anophelis]MBE9394986.1 MFS transporter [Elizabethkingia anophelis]MBE9409038.1 MFS transporter [Elizabethkingia anophelis]MBG0505439.1 MFS transporter [Elizabethkingia anophelis]